MTSETEKELLLRWAGACADEVYLRRTGQWSPTFWSGLSPNDLDTISRVLREAAEGWRPIETAPVDGTRFLATHIKSGVMCVTWAGKTSHVPLYGWCHGDDPEDIDHWEPTHWRPLPPPPATETTNSQEPRHD